MALEFVESDPEPNRRGSMKRYDLSDVDEEFEGKESSEWQLLDELRKSLEEE